MIRFSQLPWGLAIGLVAALQASAAPSVNVGMTAAFSAGPYLLELLETAAAENSTAYFPLLDRIATGHFISAKTEADLYAAFLEVLQHDGHITSPDALSTFSLALSLRSAAPRIEAHYQYYATAVASNVKDASSHCSDWIQLDGNQYCGPSLKDPKQQGILPSHVKHLPFDRTTGVGRVAVLYADPTSVSFPALHKILREASSKGELQYRLRYRAVSDGKREALPVSGYGVELALKRTDYIVIDDREASQDAEQKPIGSAVDLDEPEEVADLKPLSTSELASLGMKAASFIMQTANPLETLVKLTQDFPKFSATIATHEMSSDFEAEYMQNREHKVPQGINWLWMNGVQLIERQIEPLTLVEMIRRERKLISGVRDLGLNGQEAVSLLGHRMIASAKSDSGSSRYDWTDQLEDGRVIMWLNDLENDSIYAEYPKNLASLMQRTYPGQLPPIAKNIFNVIVPVDLANIDDLAAIGQLTSIIVRGIPIRFGLVPLAPTSGSSAHARIAYHLFESYGTDALLEYLRQASETPAATADEKAFSAAVAESQLQPDSSAMTLTEVLEAESYTQQVGLAKHWARRLNADTDSRTVFADGVAVPRVGQWLQPMVMELTQDLQTVQKGIFQNLITDDTWIPGLFLDGALANRNAYVLPDESKGLQILDVNKLQTEHSDLFTTIPVLESFSESTKENWAVLTVISDLTQDAGLDLLLAALEFKRNSPGVRLDVIHNPVASSGAAQINAALKSQEVKLAEVETLDGLKGLLGNGDAADDSSHAAALSSFLAVTKIQPGTQVLLLNGRIVGPILPEIPFEADDFQQLLDYEQKSRILPVYEAIEDLGLADRLSSAIAAAKVTSLTALSTISDLPEGIFESAPSVRTALYENWASEHTAIEVGDPKSASIHIAGLLNPLSEQGQRWAPILKVLSELDGVYLKLFLNPKQKIEELPVKRFFRYVLDSKPTFDESGRVKPLQATFTGLPSEALLTAGMDVPPAWLVAPKASVHDLDNIKLSSVKSDVDATYELEHILIEGHSREGKGQPPRGAQLVLGTETDSHITDTIIMSNLGYFQFKANPGYYSIQLEEGRSTDIYQIESIGAQGWAPVAGDEGTDVALMDFQGTTLYPRLERRPGMEEADVLEQDAGSDDNIVSKGIKLAGSFFGSSASSKSVSAEQHAEINIFSVASGHLYERMLNIMMVSVMKHTKHTVKFWFIEQFLSPSFKDSIPHLAAAYGFRYEMVTYKWPHWLRQQKEKQREIWGYKILFLDVLFPLSLDKVIFVDADQVVRADMHDLVDHDLEGAPYGFTPMCDSRTEMEGFRFWKQGYWAGYLRGRPYHISALYVVDLRRFRQLAAGDRLRQQYHALSADPGSLSNLDQDLPNHMQFQIPIHSLPQEWLWCETWCSDESLPSARTIDLCNNPQTKEPKLDRARRQVPEWTLYDDEIAAVLDGAGKGEGRDQKSEGVNTKSRRFEEPVHTMDEL